MSNVPNIPTDDLAAVAAGLSDCVTELRLNDLSIGRRLQVIDEARIYTAALRMHMRAGLDIEPTFGSWQVLSLPELVALLTGDGYDTIGEVLGMLSAVDTKLRDMESALVAA